MFLFEPVFEIFERENHIEKFRVLLGFLLLGDAWPDEYDGDVVAVVSAQQLAMRKQGRQQRRKDSAGIRDDTSQTKSTTTGQAVEIQMRSVLAVASVARTLSDTCCAPSAVSDTAKKPSFLSA